MAEDVCRNSSVKTDNGENSDDKVSINGNGDGDASPHFEVKEEYVDYREQICDMSSTFKLPRRSSLMKKDILCRRHTPKKTVSFFSMDKKIATGKIIYL